MLAGSEHPQAQLMGDVSLPDLVQHVLENFAQDMSADMLCVYAYSQDLREAVLIASTPDRPHELLSSVVATFCASGHLSAITDGSEVLEANVASVQFLLFRIDDEPIGALVLLSRSKVAKTPPHLREHYCFAAIQGLLQNQYRSNSEAVSRTIQAIARQVGEGVSPQELVNIVSEYLLESDIRFCALLLYGPRREDRPNGPFAFLDLQGVWSNRFG